LATPPKFSGTGALTQTAVDKLNKVSARAFAPITGDGVILASQTESGATTLKLSVNQLLPKLPQYKRVCVVKITSNATGGGQYNGKILTGTSNADGSADLAMPEGMNVPVAEDCLIINPDENGLPTHWLKLDEFAIGHVIGQTADATPKKIVEINGSVARTASPSTLGDGTEGTETADTHTWTRAAVTDGVNYGDCPIEEWYVSRIVYNDTGDQVLYSMMRKRTYSADGRLVSISAETRVSVDTTELC
jgi:hypothetical protein